MKLTQNEIREKFNKNINASVSWLLKSVRGLLPCKQTVSCKSCQCGVTNIGYVEKYIFQLARTLGSIFDILSGHNNNNCYL